jgi:hypothetical protein
MSGSRGGRRDGAGAPVGNANALRTGRYSPRVRALEDLLEDISTFASLVASVAGPGQEELCRLAFTLQCDAQHLLRALQDVTGRQDQSNARLRFASPSLRAWLASEVFR